ncbi:MAG: hypothetical protein AAFX76_08880, partial [Planctomycetota bacterium]
MIVYGSRMYFVRNVVKTWNACPHCGKYGKCRSYDGRRFGHLYFVPLIPEGGGRKRVFKECGKCKTGTHVPLPEAEAMYGRIESLLPRCVEAAGRGERGFREKPEDAEMRTGPAVAEMIDLLHTTGHAGDVPGVIELLRSEGAAYETAVAECVDADTHGEPEAAERAMERARRAAPDEVMPALWLSDFAARGGRIDDQLRYLDEAIALAPDDMGLLLTKAGVLESQKRFVEAHPLLERCLEEMPALRGDKALMKRHKKAAKAAGVKPILGMEAYVAPGDRRDRSRSGQGEKAYYHLVLLARDRE